MSHQLGTFLVDAAALDVVTELADHLVERQHLFIGDAGLGDRDQIVDRARVDDGKEAAGVAWLAVGFEGFKAGLFEDGEGVHKSFEEKKKAL